MDGARQRLQPHASFQVCWRGRQQQGERGGATAGGEGRAGCATSPQHHKPAATPAEDAHQAAAAGDQGRDVEMMEEHAATAAATRPPRQPVGNHHTKQRRRLSLPHRRGSGCCRSVKAPPSVAAARSPLPTKKTNKGHPPKSQGMGTGVAAASAPLRHGAAARADEAQGRRFGCAKAPPPCLPWRREAPTATDAAGTHQKPRSATTTLSVGRPSGDWPGGAGRRPPCAPRHGRGSREIPITTLALPTPQTIHLFCRGGPRRGSTVPGDPPSLSDLPQVRVSSGQHGGSHVTAHAGGSARPAAQCTRVVVPTRCVRTVEKTCSDTQRPGA